MIRPETGFERIFASGFVFVKSESGGCYKYINNSKDIDIYHTGVYYIRNDYKMIIIR